MNKTLVIAEAGNNHNGDFSKAIKLVKIAKNSGADMVKFQLFSTKYFINKNFKSKKNNFLKIYKRFKSLEFSVDQWKKIIQFGKKKSIKVFFSIFDEDSIMTLKKLGVKTVKIPSGEITNISLLKEINKRKFKVILSTGMSNISEISQALKYLRNCKVDVLHCISEYPTYFPNLGAINLLKTKFKKKIGYSDHSKSLIVPALSVMIGAHIIEKHFTYNKNQKYGDHKMSLNPPELKEMIRNIRFAEKCVKKTQKKVTQKEKKLQFIARKAVYLNRDLSRGQIVKKRHLSFLRPMSGIPAEKYFNIINKRSTRNIKKNIPLKNFFFK